MNLTLRKPILFVDNHDSFAWSIIRMFDPFAVKVLVQQNHELSRLALIPSEHSAVVLGPGPGLPQDAGALMELIAVLERAAVPTLGICLGHQALGIHFGWKLLRAKRLMHGKTSPIGHLGTGLFHGLPEDTPMMRYHSWVVQPDLGVDTQLTVTARSKDTGEVMGLAHQTLPIHGLQFHPESFLSYEGQTLMANFMHLVFEHEATKM